MAKQIYMLCSESGSEDKTTGLFSHFKVIERFQVKSVAGSPGDKILVVPSFQFQIVSVWGRDDSDDPDQEYQYRFLLYFPPNSEEIVATSGTFRFSSDFHRILVNASGTLFAGPGMFRAECRIRPIHVGEEPEWLAQSYSFAVVDTEATGQTPSA